MFNDLSIIVENRSVIHQHRGLSTFQISEAAFLQSIRIGMSPVRQEYFVTSVLNYCCTTFWWQTRCIMGDEHMANYCKIETLGRVGFWELSLLAIGGQQNSAGSRRHIPSCRTPKFELRPTQTI